MQKQVSDIHIGIKKKKMLVHMCDTCRPKEQRNSQNETQPYKNNKKKSWNF